MRNFRPPVSFIYRYSPLHMMSYPYKQLSPKALTGKLSLFPRLRIPPLRGVHLFYSALCSCRGVPFLLLEWAGNYPASPDNAINASDLHVTRLNKLAHELLFIQFFFFVSLPYLSFGVDNTLFKREVIEFSVRFRRFGIKQAFIELIPIQSIKWQHLFMLKKFEMFLPTRKFFSLEVI